jgi:hypothetical protein
MGRKGVTKWKPVQTKSKPLSGNATFDSVSSVLKAAENQPIRSLGIGKSTSPAESSGKTTTNQKKKAKKG